MSYSALQGVLFVCLRVLAQHVPAAGGVPRIMPQVVHGLILIVSTRAAVSHLQ